MQECTFHPKINTKYRKKKSRSVLIGDRKSNRVLKKEVVEERDSDHPSGAPKTDRVSVLRNPDLFDDYQGEGRNGEPLEGSSNGEHLSFLSSEVNSGQLDQIGDPTLSKKLGLVKRVEDRFGQDEANQGSLEGKEVGKDSFALVDLSGGKIEITERSRKAVEVAVNMFK